MASSGVQVTPLRGRGDRRAFRALPHRLYADDPHWVAPLNRDIEGFLSPRHPFAENGTIQGFLARRGRTVVGRITAIENRTHNAFHGDRLGFFGFFETEDDPEVSEALLDTAAAWLRQRGLDRVRGPLSPSTNYEAGLLLEGGDPGPPALMMAHQRSYYARHLEAWGLQKAQDLLAYYLHDQEVDTARWARIADKVLARQNSTFRQIDLGRFDDEVSLIVDIYQDAWSKNWGFVPMSDGEVRRMAKELRPIIVPWLTGFVQDVSGRDVAFFLALPDYNRILIDLKGRLFPFGFLKLLRARGKIDFMRLLLLGVRKEAHHMGLDGILYAKACSQCLSHDIHACEASWVLHDNLPMRQAMERCGGRLYRTYRVYERAL